MVRTEPITGLPWPQISKRTFPAFTRDGILYVPYMLFIDAKGIIRGDFSGKDGFFSESDKRIRAELDKLAKPAAAPAAKKK